MDRKIHVMVRSRFCSTSVGRLGCALLSGVVLLGASAALAGQVAPASVQPIDAVTVGQPRVAPAEFNGDLSKLPPVTPTIGEPPIYRPLLPGPMSTKYLRYSPPAPSAPIPPEGPLAPMPSPRTMISPIPSGNQISRM